jgi:hypothetical protein
LCGFADAVYKDVGSGNTVLESDMRKPFHIVKESRIVNTENLGSGFCDANGRETTLIEEETFKFR